MNKINAIIASLALSGVAAGEQEMDVLDRVQIDALLVHHLSLNG